MLSAAPEFVSKALIAITTSARTVRNRTRRKVIATTATTPSATAGRAPSPTPEPVVSAGHILLTVADNRRTISVPVGTVVDIVLNGGSWSVPVSSNPQSLPRSSSASSCDGVRASFRVQGNGWIEAHTNTPKGMGAPDIIFRVTVRVVS
jgi:hypothetical protein